MSDSLEKVIPVAIEDELKESYLNYAMSVIVSRALPDARDGLKPVHRRILYSMREMALRSDRPHKKTGRIVGDVLGKFHPHGDQSIYDALVRLAQDFSLRYPAINGQGNFGSIDGDPPAAMRYTEARLSAIAEEMLRDIDRETVDFGPNYDDSLNEPLVLPGAFPFLLANGGSGIAVGMATNIPPHNIHEICRAIVHRIEQPKITIEELMKIVKAPDFPTGGIVYGRKGVEEAYRTGYGRIIVRARVTLETGKNGKEYIVVKEIPFAVNKSSLIIKIADLVREKKIEGIADLNDESDRDGLRIVIELRRNAVPKVILNQLFMHTQMQVAFSANCLALVHGAPRVLNLKEMIECFIEHRKEVVTRRARYDLKKAEQRAHILEGLRIALDNIDEVIALIKKSRTVDTARSNLIKRFKLSERQAQAVLDMRLQRLTSLETKKILDELQEVLKKIKALKDLLSSEKKILNVVKEETLQIEQRYGDERRTELIEEEVEEIDIEDLIVREDVVILFSHRGFIKRMPVSAYKRQGRGGRGASYTTLKENDVITHMFIASTHDYILFITSTGSAYWLKVHEIPEGSKTSRGKSIKTLFSISTDEKIAAVVSTSCFSEEAFIFMATKRGIVKKVRVSEFSNAKTRGIAAINLVKGDRLVSANLTTGNDELIFITQKGASLRFHERAVRAMGRSSKGMIGIRPSKEDELCGVVIVRKDEHMLIISQSGYGKRIDYKNFVQHGRGTRGRACYPYSKVHGKVAAVLSVGKRDDLICITSQGNAIKLRLKEVTVRGRNAAGVKIVNIKAPDSVVGIARASKET